MLKTGKASSTKKFFRELKKNLAELKKSFSNDAKIIMTELYMSSYYRRGDSKLNALSQCMCVCPSVSLSFSLSNIYTRNTLD